MIKFIICLICICTIIQTYRVTISWFRKDTGIVVRIIESLVLILCVFVSLADLKIHNMDICSKLFHIGSEVLCCYVLGSFIFEVVRKKQYISILSVKSSIDLSSNGIMFLNNKGNIILINNMMRDILSEKNIMNNFIDRLIDSSFRVIDDVYLIRSLERVWYLKVQDGEQVVMIDITDVYKLQEIEEEQNRSIEANNKKILSTLENIEEIEKSKNLIKLKNEFHDLLGHRLSLFQQYLNKKNVNIDDISYMLDNLFVDTDNLVSPDLKLEKLVNVYKVFGVNIKVVGGLPIDEKIAEVFFEIIREAVTNAIIHADSHNIKVVITQNLERVEMIITNDGAKPKNFISENEGIKGMRRKLKDVGGVLTVGVDKQFILKVSI